MKANLRACQTLALVLAVTLIGFSGAGPDIRYTRVSKIEFGSKAINFLARLGGATKEIPETVYLKGGKMRTDAGDASTVIDLDEERIVTLDHKRKAYSILTFDELLQAVEDVMTDAGEIADTDVEPEEPGADEETVEIDVDFNVDRTGERSKINGFDAERVLMTVTIEGTTRDTSNADSEVQEGTLVILSELWMSKNLQGYEEVDDFSRRHAEKLAEAYGETELRDLGSQLEEAFASDPRIAEGMERAKEESAKIEGVDVKSTTYVVGVAGGAKFDPDLIFAKKQEPKAKKGGLGRFAQRIAKSAAGVQDQEDEQPAPQSVIVTISSEMKEFDVSSLDGSLFGIPSGYKETAARK